MLDVQITLKPSPGLAEALDRVRGLAANERTDARDAMAAAVEELTRRHLLDMGVHEHKTALSLDATPTGFWSKAAGTVQAHSTPDGVQLSMQRAGLTRAFRDVTIRATRSRLLTIPVTRESYGKRAREFTGLKWRTFSQKDVLDGKTDRAGLVLGQPAAELGGIFHALFRGTPAVFQEQDRELLPPDDDWLGVMEDAALTWLEAG